MASPVTSMCRPASLAVRFCREAEVPLQRIKEYPIGEPDLITRMADADVTSASGSLSYNLATLVCFDTREGNLSFSRSSNTPRTLACISLPRGS